MIDRKRLTVSILVFVCLLGSALAQAAHVRRTKVRGVRVVAQRVVEPRIRQLRAVDSRPQRLSVRGVRTIRDLRARSTRRR